MSDQETAPFFLRELSPDGEPVAEPLSYTIQEYTADKCIHWGQPREVSTDDFKGGSKSLLGRLCKEGAKEKAPLRCNEDATRNELLRGPRMAYNLPR